MKGENSHEKKKMKERTANQEGKRETREGRKRGVRGTARPAIATPGAHGSKGFNVGEGAVERSCQKLSGNRISTIGTLPVFAISAQENLCAFEVYRLCMHEREVDSLRN